MFLGQYSHLCKIRTYQPWGYWRPDHTKDPLLVDWQWLHAATRTHLFVICCVILKLKSYPTTRHESAWGQSKCSFHSFSTSALDEGEWSASHPDLALPPGKGPPVPVVQEAGWAPEPIWTQRLEEKSFSLCRGSNFDRSVVQFVARHYTDWATRLILLTLC
jgi:hypothetical protein